ncbi:lipase family protein [Corynebacterium sp.]|uniref:lipase family protein n=1 Tax=Corynebacterium sp. TaxID=1720 RepID=UPI0025BC4DBC|nr:lipase family protein [Corynebacterium sp.]
MGRTAGRTVRAALAGLAVAAGLVTVPAQAQTLPWGGHAPRVEAGDVDPFYDTADLVPGTPGTVLRTASAPYAPAPPGPDGRQFAVPDRVRKIMYSTTDTAGRPVAVSGYTVEPTVPWTGPGERPTVVVGRGTVGQGDQCAPSRNWPLDNQPDPLDSGRTVALEGAYDWAFASQGVRVVVTDYVGMGTPGMHTYMNRAEQAHAMIDAARAVRTLVEERGGTFGPVGFYGHSQGGGASTAAVEVVADYAPDLDVAGAYASAPPADLEEVQRTIDGSNLVGAIGFTINGLNARYPSLAAELDTHLSGHGREVLDDLAGMCTDEIGDTYGYQTTDRWTADGRRLDDLLGEIPEGVRAMEEQRIGTGTPAAPTMVVSGRHDKTVDYTQARELAATWCTAGAPVVYRDDVLPEISDQNHFLQAVSGSAFGIPFLLDRFHGRPVGGTCAFPA